MQCLRVSCLRRLSACLRRAGVAAPPAGLNWGRRWQYRSPEEQRRGPGSRDAPAGTDAGPDCSRDRHPELRSLSSICQMWASLALMWLVLIKIERGFKVKRASSKVVLILSFTRAVEDQKVKWRQEHLKYLTFNKNTIQHSTRSLKKTIWLSNGHFLFRIVTMKAQPCMPTCNSNLASHHEGNSPVT